MIRISLPWVFKVIEAIDSLSHIRPGQRVAEVWMVVFSVRSSIEALNVSAYRPYLRSSLANYQDFSNSLNTILSRDIEKYPLLNEFEVANLLTSKQLYKTILLADLGVIPSFIVERKESYDVNVLLDEGHLLFPSEMTEKIPETKHDATAAARCLAFELGTACGFHTFRVTETAVRRYWDAVTNGEARPKVQTLGSFVTELEKRADKDDKLLSSINQPNKLHRNPTIHPEVILTVREAIGIIGLSRSIVEWLLPHVPFLPQTVTSPTTTPSALGGLFGALPPAFSDTP